MYRPIPWWISKPPMYRPIPWWISLTSEIAAHTLHISVLYASQISLLRQNFSSTVADFFPMLHFSLLYAKPNFFSLLEFLFYGGEFLSYACTDVSYARVFLPYNNSENPIARTEKYGRIEGNPASIGGLYFSATVVLFMRRLGALPLTAAEQPAHGPVYG